MHPNESLAAGQSSSCAFSVFPTEQPAAENPDFDWCLPPIAFAGGLEAVPAYDLNLLPTAFRARVVDVAERASTPPEMVAAPLMVAASGVIGRGAVILPRRKSDWAVVPNYWGAAVADSGCLKTPMAEAALDALDHLESEAAKAHEQMLAIDGWRASVRDAEIDHQKKLMAASIKKSDYHAANEAAKKVAELEAKQVGGPKRYKVVDATTEKLGELLRDNPRGLTCWRDELVGWIKGFERHGREGDRGFYLSAQNGTTDATVDRIGRGTVRIPCPTLALFGTTQPGPLAALVAEARNGVGADGLLARVQLLVWPDAVPYKPCERWPDHEAKQEVRRIFRQIAEADYSSRGGHVDQFGGPPAFRFDAEAQAIFDVWFEALEVRLRSGEIEDPALKSALSKYRSLVPSLALVYHLVAHVDSDKIPPVDVAAVESAIGWAVYLEAHARRVYGCSGGAAVLPGARLARRLSDLPDGFTRRDLQRKGWSGLKSPEELDRAIQAACERRWILAHQAESGTEGGRPTVRYWKNPVDPVSAASAGPFLAASDLVGVVAEWAAASDDRWARITPEAAGLYQLQVSSNKCHKVQRPFPIGAPEEDLLAMLDDLAVDSRRLGPRDVQAELAEVQRLASIASAVACAESEARMYAQKAAGASGAGVMHQPPAPPAPVPVPTI